MIRRPPRATRTDTLFPYTTLFRSTEKPCHAAMGFLGFDLHQERLLFSLEPGGDAAALCVGPQQRPRRRHGAGLLCQQCVGPAGNRGVEPVFGHQGRGEAEPDHLFRRHTAVQQLDLRSEARRGGKEWVTTCKSRLLPYHLKKKKYK